MFKTFHIFANAALGRGLSGGDRIFIEFAKRLSKHNQVIIHVWQEGYQMCKKQGLSQTRNLKFVVMNVNFWCKFGFLMCYLARITGAVFNSLFMSLKNDRNIIVYSASEFWMDSFPAIILKLRFPQITWAASWYQTAPNPIQGFSEGSREKLYRFSAFYHWFMQVPIKPIIENLADFVLVNNDQEKKQFPNLNKKSRVIAILGAVNIDQIEEWRHKFSKENFTKKYDGVFQGRFHPQKGVVELIDIWKKVTEKLPDAKMAMIGDGPLMNDVKDRIKELNLKENIYLFGYVFDGYQKYRIFSQSRIVVHPAFFDSGGMASAEAMAFGLPCVGFNLDSYKSYYPKGMVKVPVGDLNLFAKNIVELISSKPKREEIGKEAQKMIQQNWNWDQRVNQLLALLDRDN